MTIQIDRRSLILSGSFGLGALAISGGAGAAALLTARGFTHGVASGEPAAGSVLLWTRYIAANGDDAPLAVEMSDTVDFALPKAGGTATAERARDFTARITVTGLEPDRWYFYRFIAADGSKSAIGRTRTLPDGPVARFGLGVFSCANLPFGWFNAYAHAADRGDLDLIVHLGDYIYEYQRGTYPGVEQALKSRLIDLQPTGEIIHLADYRLRYAGYRADMDLRRVHQLFPMIAQFDDHEVANDTWQDGAENHQPEEGDFAVRKAAAVQAWHEWMPVSDKAYSQYEIGDLATIFRPETRVTARSKQLAMAAVLKDRALLADPARTMMGGVQEAWLSQGIAASVKRGAKWQVLAMQTNMGQLFTPAGSAALLPPGAPDYLVKAIQGSELATTLGVPRNLDNWGGYPAARTRLLTSAQQADADLIVLAGDSHNGWAFDLPGDGASAGVEFGGHSVSSPGFEAYLAAAPDDVTKGLLGSSPELKWADTSRRGYMAVELTPERVSGEWVFMETIRARSTALAGTHSMSVKRGKRAFDPLA